MYISYWIIGITSIVSYLAFQNRSLFERYMFRKGAFLYQKEYYRLFSHALLHGDWMHLIFNMLALFSFGRILEQYFEVYVGDLAPIYFSVFYIISIAAASSVSVFRASKPDYYSSVGASGAISAVIGAVIVFDPAIPIGFFFIPIPIPGYAFAVLYVLLSSWADKKGGGNIAHDVHIAGLLFGIFGVLFLIPESRTHLQFFIQNLLN